jgi:hypothetical protein
MKYQVYARDEWTADLKEQFGESYSIHDLSDAEVVAAIKKHGRAEITTHDDPPMTLEFQNGYD